MKEKSTYSYRLMQKCDFKSFQLCYSTRYDLIEVRKKRERGPFFYMLYSPRSEDMRFRVDSWNWLYQGERQQFTDVGTKVILKRIKNVFECTESRDMPSQISLTKKKTQKILRLFKAGMEAVGDALLGEAIG